MANDKEIRTDGRTDKEIRIIAEEIMREDRDILRKLANGGKICLQGVEDG
jgi:hypothetical protein